jgi:transcriptional regulator with XRE-family HTH domain
MFPASTMLKVNIILMSQSASVVMSKIQFNGVLPSVSSAAATAMKSRSFGSIRCQFRHVPGCLTLYAPLLHASWLPASTWDNRCARCERGRPRMAVEGPDPTVHRRRLRSELRKARETARLTQRDVAKAMDWSLSKLIRIETGVVSISTNDLRALLAHYGISNPVQVDAMIDIARASRERSWWSGYRELASQEYLIFLGYESSASVIRNFEPLVIPGLLQTEEYAREILSMIGGIDNKKIVDALVDLRMQRQELLLERNTPPSLHFILDEAAVRRVVGGSSVMRRQLNHVMDIASRPNVTVRIMPFDAGMYPRLRVAYVLLEFPDPEDEDILYIENPQGEMIIREGIPEETEGEATPVTYLGVFWQLEQTARKENTPGIVQDAIDKLPVAPAGVPGSAAQEEKVGRRDRKSEEAAR